MNFVNVCITVKSTQSHTYDYNWIRLFLKMIKGQASKKYILKILRLLICFVIVKVKFHLFLLLIHQIFK